MGARRRWTRWCLIAVIAGAWVTCGKGLDEGQFECELAVAHLADCCPDFATDDVRCTYATGCTQTDFPDLSPDESRCIAALDCSAVRTMGLCSKVQNLPPTQIEDPTCPATHPCDLAGAAPTVTGHAPVCP